MNATEKQDHIDTIKEIATDVLESRGIDLGNSPVCRWGAAYSQWAEAYDALDAIEINAAINDARRELQDAD